MTSRAGYGGALCNRFTVEVTCINKARAGRSSGSFRKEGRWDEVQQMLRDSGQFSASYVLIQFGHNDQPGKPGHSTNLANEYPVNLARYVADARSLGAVPILVTPLTRRTFQGAELRDTLGPWAEAARKVAIEEDALLLDLHMASSAAIQAMGQAEADTLGPPPRLTSSASGSSHSEANSDAPVKKEFDRTHLDSKGAVYFARMVEKELTQSVPTLMPYFKQD